MKIIGINPAKCNSCKECVKECVSGLFLPYVTEEKMEIIHSDPYENCTKCGHCIAVCSQNAIEFENVEQSYEFEEAKSPSSIINYEIYYKLIRARRSIRRYKNNSISKEDISKVLEAMRYAPSAHSSQSWRYVVLTNSESIENLRQITISYVPSLLKLLNRFKILKFMLPKEVKEVLLKPNLTEGLKNMIERLAKGEDLVFYKAPAVIITYSAGFGDDRMNGAEAGIALTHGMLAAQSLGLGTCWIGFAQEALNKSKKNKELFNIPKDSKVYGVLTLGYPSVKYYRSPPRNPLHVSWK